MYRAHVVTSWISGPDATGKTSWHPKLANDHDVLCEDVTQQLAANIPPAPNEYTVEIVCSEEILDEIEADSAYFVSWSEEIIESPV